MKHCELCGRREHTTRHHLFPRCLHRRLRRKKALPGETLHHTVEFCTPCHKRIHQIFSEKELAEEFHSLERLKADARVNKWLDWIRGKPQGFRPRTESYRRWSARRRG